MNLRGRETEEERTKGGREGARFFQIIRQTTDFSLALVDISSELPEAPLSSLLGDAQSTPLEAEGGTICGGNSGRRGDRGGEQGRTAKLLEVPVNSTSPFPPPTSPPREN